MAQINKVWPATGHVTIREMLDGIPGDILKKTALTMKTDEGYKSLTYSEMIEAARNIGNAMSVMGIKKGDRIGLLAENRNEWIVSYLAVTYMGAVVVPFDSLLSEDALRFLLPASGIKMIFTSAKYLDKYREVFSEAQTLKQMIIFDICKDLEEDLKEKKLFSGKEKDKKHFAFDWPELARKAAEEKAPYSKRKFLYMDEMLVLGRIFREKGVYPVNDISVEKDDVAAGIYTSGTTGLPKGVLLSHGNLVTNGDAIQQTSVPLEYDNWILVLPLHHTFPTITGIFVPFQNYGMVTTIPTFRSDKLTEIMDETGATYIPAVPLLVEKIYKKIMTNVMKSSLPVKIVFRAMYAVSSFFYRHLKIRVGKYIFASVRKKAGMRQLTAFICGGGAIPADVIHAMNILGLRVGQGYGLTETSPVVSSCVPAHDRPGSVGLPLVNVDVRIVEPDSEGNGVIHVKGESVMLGYDEDPEATAKVLKDGWLDTGDIGYLDEDGYLYITGRKKDLIIVFLFWAR